MLRRFALPFLLMLLSAFASAQQLPLPLSRSLAPELEQSLYETDSAFHTALRPWLESEVRVAVDPDSLQRLYYFRERGKRKFPNWLFRKAFNEHFVDVRTKNFLLQVDPVGEFALGKDMAIAQNRRFMNSRGLQLQGNIGKKFSFFSTYYENQGAFVNWERDYIQSTRVVPGQGLARGFGDGGFDWAWASGLISYTPSPYVNLQLGHGKQFVGDGYRSLLLSDQSFNYPYLRVSAKVWRLQYMITYAQFMDLKLPHGANTGFKKKYGTFHYLSYAVNKRLKLGLFEAVIWRASDSTGFRGFDLNYLSPIIFFRPVEFSQGSPDNVLVGLNASMRVRKHTTLYGQFVLDEIKVHEIFSGEGWWGNKLGFQLGFRTYELAGLKNLSLQSEFNFVRPYTYTSRASDLCYGHYNEPLAHPLGANFLESLTRLNYHYGRFFAELGFNYTLSGRDADGLNYGSDIFAPYTNRPFEYGNYTGQGLKTKIYTGDASVSYLINPATRLNIALGLSERWLSNSAGTEHCSYLYVALRTKLFSSE